MDYRYAHNLKELNSFSKEGYEFLSVIDPNTFLMVLKEEELPAVEITSGSNDTVFCKHPGCGYTALADTEGKARNIMRLHSKKHEPRANQNNS